MVKTIVQQFQQFIDEFVEEIVLQTEPFIDESVEAPIDETVEVIVEQEIEEVRTEVEPEDSAIDHNTQEIKYETIEDVQALEQEFVSAEPIVEDQPS